MSSTGAAASPSLLAVLRHWGRIGCIGFGGPPTHIRLLRQLCVEEQGWIDATEFEDAIATCNLLPGPASTQLAIYCAWRVRGRTGALVGGAAFIVPGLVLILALAALVLGSPPRWVLGAGAGAGAAVAAVAVHAGSSLVPASWGHRRHRVRWLGYVVAGALAAALLGPLLVLVLLLCGLVELAAARLPGRETTIHSLGPLPLLGAAFVGSGVLLSLAWVAFKVAPCPTAAAS
jgi:chromate transporter